MLRRPLTRSITVSSQPALERCEKTLGCNPKQIVADGDYTNHASVQAAAACGVDFYGSWQDSWKPGERDAQGRSAAFLASAFPYDAEQDCFTCPAGEILTHHALLNRGHGVRIARLSRSQAACRSCPLRGQCAPPKARPAWMRSITRIEEPAATDRIQGQDGDRRGTTDLRETLADRRVSACLD